MSDNPPPAKLPPTSPKVKKKLPPLASGTLPSLPKPDNVLIAGIAHVADGLSDAAGGVTHTLEMGANKIPIHHLFDNYQTPNGTV